jgi:hypothetical protein
MRPGRGRKRNGVAVIAVIAAILALSLATAGTSAAGAAGLRPRHCGTLQGPGAKFTILAYQARCTTARHVFTGLFAGHGRPRRVEGKTYKVIDGWICGSAAGGFSCGKLGPRGTLPHPTPQHLGPTLNAFAPY